jgi:1-acyl-sn-glycerol-3-phosphate acyltransferase
MESKVEPVIEKKEKSKIKQLTDTLLKYNPIDPAAAWFRKQLKNLGLLEIFDEAIYWEVGYVPFKLIFKTLWNYKVTKGKSNMPEYGPVIVVPNHQCEFDPYLVGCAVHRKVQWLSKSENFDYPIYKTIIEPFGTIPLKRGQSDTEALNKVRAVLNSGGCVGIFPEGTRSPDGKLAKFHTGAARLCLETGAAYLPVAIIGAHKILAKNKNFLHTKIGIPVEVRIGKPVYLDPSIEPTPENLKQIAMQMQARVQALIDGYELPTQKVEFSTEGLTPDEIRAKIEGDHYAQIADELSIA